MVRAVRVNLLLGSVVLSPKSRSALWALLECRLVCRARFGDLFKAPIAGTSVGAMFSLGAARSMSPIASSTMTTNYYDRSRLAGEVVTFHRIRDVHHPDATNRHHSP